MCDFPQLVATTKGKTSVVATEREKSSSMSSRVKSLLSMSGKIFRNLVRKYNQSKIKLNNEHIIGIHYAEQWIIDGNEVENSKQKYAYDILDDNSHINNKQSLQEQPEYYLEKQNKIPKRYKRSLSISSASASSYSPVQTFKHLITKKDETLASSAVKVVGVAVPDDDDDDEDDKFDEYYGSTNVDTKDLTNAQTFNDNKVNIMMAEPETEEEVEYSAATNRAGEDNDKDSGDTLMLKSNYDKEFMNEEEDEEQQEFETTFSPKVDETLTSAPKSSSSSPPSSALAQATILPASSGSMSSSAIDNDKTLKINNILNLNQSKNNQEENNIDNMINKKENEVEQNGDNETKLLNEADEVPLSPDNRAVLETSTVPSSQGLVKSTTEKSLFTIFVNYNYDEEEALGISEDISSEYQSGNSKTLPTSAKQVLTSGLNQNMNIDNIIDGSLIKVENSPRPSGSKEVNNDGHEQAVLGGGDIIDSAIELYDHNSKSTQKNYDTHNVLGVVDRNDKDDNNFRINRFERLSNDAKDSDTDIDSMTFNSHHLSDSNDDIYLTTTLTPPIPSHLPNFADKREAVDEEDQKKELLNDENLKTFTHNHQHSGQAKKNVVNDLEMPENSLENLMLNDGLLPLNAHNGYVEMNFSQNLDDIDIVKLEQTHSSEDELYKTIDFDKTLATLGKEPKIRPQMQYPQPHPNKDFEKHWNEVIKREEEWQRQRGLLPSKEKDGDEATFVQPVTSAPVETIKPYKTEIVPHPANDKRIVVNLTIGSNDGTGNMYTLHVDIPAFQENGQIQNVQQVLTHEYLPPVDTNSKVDAKVTATLMKKGEEKENSRESVTTQKPNVTAPSPYCIPEPPPPIPECPCACGMFPLGGVTSSSATDSILTSIDTSSESSSRSTTTMGEIANDNDNDFDNDLFKITTITNTEARTSPPSTIASATSTTTTIPINTSYLANNDETTISSDDNLNASDGTTNMPDIDVSTSSAKTNNTNASSNMNGEKFACPDVMPILILEGDLCFLFFCFYFIVTF